MSWKNFNYTKIGAFIGAIIGFLVGWGFWIINNLRYQGPQSAECNFIDCATFYGNIMFGIFTLIPGLIVGMLIGFIIPKIEFRKIINKGFLIGGGIGFFIFLTTLVIQFVMILRGADISITLDYILFVIIYLTIPPAIIGLFIAWVYKKIKSKKIE